MKRSYIILLMMLLAFALQAQHSSNAYRTLADSLYRNHHYRIAADYYVKALKKAPQPASIMLQLAKSYEKINNIQTASEWYSKARANGAVFTNLDTYEYAQTLMMLNQRAEAGALLEQLVAADPNDLQARQLLDDVTHYQKYYKDSAQAIVRSLVINTPVSDFAPAFYKDGIVFTSATPQKSSKKKYHWDNSYFLSLVYSKVNGETVEKPQLFEKENDSEYHDGPATFYDNDERMIVNRNQPSKVAGQEDTYVWHIALFDAQRTADKAGWELKALPFDQPPYSFAHPAISENGNVLYFVSDKPGGYGGTDIYRSVRTNGVWSKPYNLGPVVNTSENEVFPFFIDDVLYFGSNGHGGLGGLDIFKSKSGVNGFEPPVNLGYPINSIRDDFSFITRPDQHSGYMSSARNGNDDLFSYRLLAGMMNVLARITDDSKQPLPGATIQIMTATGDDITVVSDDNGNFSFSLPEGTAYMIIGNKDDKVGMVSGYTDPNESESVQELVVRDDNKVPCVVSVMSETGSQTQPNHVSIVDETTGEEQKFTEEHSLISFSGEQNHRYRVTIENENGDTTSRALTLTPTNAESARLSMILKNATFLMAARIYNAETQAPLGGAQVKIVTFADADKELVADDDGVVSFTLPVDAAYIVIGSRDNLTGMHSGVAARGEDKNSIIHPVPAHGDAPPPQPVLMIALVTHADGDVAKNVKATVTEKGSGKTVPVTINDGVLTFYGDRDKEYIISASDTGHEQIQEEVRVPDDAGAMEKISIVLEKSPAVRHLTAVRVINAADKSPLDGAEVRVVSFTSPDTVLIANSEGVAIFPLDEGTTYMVIGSKDRFTGMHTGMASADQDKDHVVHPVPARSENENVVPVAGLVTGEDGNTLANASVTVTETSTGKTVPSSVKNGLIMFEGEKGKDYAISVSHDDHQTTTKDILVPLQSEDVHKVSIGMRARRNVPVRQETVTQTPVTSTTNATGLTMAVRVFKSTDQKALSGAQVKIISFSEAEKEIIADNNGKASFTLPDGDTYMVIGSKDGFTGMHTGTASNSTDQQHIVHPVAAQGDAENTSSIVVMIADENGKPVRDAKATITDPTTGATVSGEVKNGMVIFRGDHEKNYSVTVTSTGREPKEQTIHVAKGNAVQSERIVLKKARATSIAATKTAATIKNKDNSANLVIVNTDTGEARFYVNTSGSFAEIVERDGTLFLQNEKESRLLGNGQLSKLKSDPRPVTDALGISPDNIVELHNVYFDYDKAVINADATAALETVRQLLTDYPSLKLVINAHADDRGRENYNLNLSRKRARAVKTHLVKAGLSKDRLFVEAFGESKPAVICETKECSEEEHRRNRRAEFVLSSKERTVAETPKQTQTQPQTTAATDKYQTVLQKYGDVEKSGVLFKITLGAYRYNDNLTFDQLKTLGTIEKTAANGITYYYLNGFNTLNRAEAARREVNGLGVPDAFISIYYNEGKITLTEFVEMADRK